MGVREEFCNRCGKWFDRGYHKNCPNCEVEMTTEEKELVESVQSVEADFYAGLIALALYRLVKSGATKSDFQLRQNIENIVVNTYRDLEFEE